MRIEITCGGTTIAAATKRLGSKAGVYVASEGIDGWYGAPAPQQEGDALPAGGSAWPASITPSARVVTVHLVADSASSEDAMRTLDIANGMFGKRVTLAVTDASGRRTVEGYLSDGPTATPIAMGRKLLLDLVITCPDPSRYGQWASADVTRGAALIVGGNAPTYPVLEIGEGVTAVTVDIGGHQVKWSGSGPAEIDFRDMRPTAGSVSVDDARPLEPGRNDVSVSRTGSGSVRMRWRPGWR